MKLIKGIMIGGVISAGALMLYAGSTKKDKKRLMKKGKKMISQLGESLL